MASVGFGNILSKRNNAHPTRFASRGAAGGRRSIIDTLTESELDDYREAFDSYDKDGGGTIDFEELDALMQSCGQHLSKEELTEMIRVADADGSGDINFAEFVTLMAHKMVDQKSEQTLESAFAVFDTDGTGFITPAELVRVMTSIGEEVDAAEVRDGRKRASPAPRP